MANTTKGRTEVINNSKPLANGRLNHYLMSYPDLSPVWDEIIYIPG